MPTLSKKAFEHGDWQYEIEKLSNGTENEHEMSILIEDDVEPVPFSLKKKAPSKKVCLFENGTTKYYRPDVEAEDGFYNQNHRYKQRMRKIILKAVGQSPQVLWKRPTPVAFHAVVFFPKGKSITYKPDLDNLAKTFADCGTKILYDDDCQIVFSTLRKVQNISDQWRVVLDFRSNPL